jgi:hypothetical protein
MLTVEIRELPALRSFLSGEYPATGPSEFLEPESVLLYDLRFTANQFVLATSPLRLTASNFIFQMNTCGYSPYVTSSLTRR